MTSRDLSDDAPPSRAGMALALLGEHWTLMILQNMFEGDQRYSDIVRTLRASDSIVSNRLRTLTDYGLLTLVPYQDGRTRHAYRLTRAGGGTWRIFVAAWLWERSWSSKRLAHRHNLIHLRCGRPTTPSVVCGRCGGDVGTGDTFIRQYRDHLDYGPIPRRHRQRATGSNELERGLEHETLEIIGDRWSLALISASLLGVRRFGEFERFLSIPPAVLSERIARFVQLEIFEAHPLPHDRGKQVYRLSAKGRDFALVGTQIIRWADDHLTEGTFRSLEILHEACGERLEAEYRCDQCEEILQRRSLRFESARPD